MKVESAFNIEGKIVEKIFQKGDIAVYQGDDELDAKLYFVNAKTNCVMFTQYISADCNQNTGFVDKIHFEGIK